MTVDVRHGDCLDILRSLPDASVDAVVTDPPYGLAEHKPTTITAAMVAWCSGDRDHVPDGRGFMGRAWDGFVPPPAVWDECLRVLKPGGHLLCFAGSRTADLMGISIRLAGFEMRDTIVWHYGSGFPKSLDVSKAIDKAAGAERAPSGEPTSLACEYVRRGEPCRGHGDGVETSQSGAAVHALPTSPATAAARQWSGWGTALKPASEPIIVARKPLTGTVAATVLAHGTGALNIDACRVGLNGERPPTGSGGPNLGTSFEGGVMHGVGGNVTPASGRWPANVVLTHADCGEECVEGCPVAELDAQSGTSKSPTTVTTGGKALGVMNDDGWQAQPGRRVDCYGDSGGASRFFPTFRYQAKAPTRERPKVDGVAHPTVKPLELMRWLVRLVTPPGGLVLDPFAGSGTTGEAALLEGMRAILIERDATYLPLIAARLERAA